MEANSPLVSDLKSSAIDQLYELYPQLRDDRNAEWLDILGEVNVMNSPPEAILAAVGSSCANFMLLLDGTVRVYQDTEDGKELTLYRIAPGDVCLMSLNSLLHDRPFRANAKSESDIRMIMFSAEQFNHAMKISDEFRMLILSNLVDTVCTMVQTFYDTAFEPLDMRLACLLGRLFERTGDDSLDVTHQELSQELGTSREVVSRLLKKLEQQECIILKRGRILMGTNKNLPGTN